MCITGNRYVDLAIGVAAVAVTAGALAPALVGTAAAPGLIGATAFNIGVGAALGATTAGALGTNPLTGALMGGAAGGFFGPAAAAGTAGTAVNAFTTTLIGGAGALALDLITPKAPTFATPAQATGAVAQIQQLNLQPLSVTGSGGPSATRSLAEAIRRTKDRKLTQGDVSDLSVDVSSFSPYGLQLAF